MRFVDFRRSLRAFGFWPTLGRLAYGAINRVTLLHLGQVMTLERAAPLAAPGPGYTFGRMEDALLRQFAGRADYELPASFLDAALARGDECWGFVCDGRIASYNWYSRQPTEIGLGGLSLHFGERWVYLYKGFTHHQHRGHGLHGLGHAASLVIQQARGARGLLAYVELGNLASLRSVHQAGFRDLGLLAVVKPAGALRAWVSSGCRPQQVRLARTDAPSPASSRPAALQAAARSSRS